MPASNNDRAMGEIASFAPPATGVPGAEAIAAYKRDGVVCLRGAFGRDWLDVIESGIEQAMALHGPSSDKVTPEGDEGYFYYDSMMWKEVEPFRRFIFESHAADLFWPFLESASLNFYYDFLLVKSARCAGAATPWHQDHSYYPLNGAKIINCWTALDPIPPETALRFVRGSHAEGTVHRVTPVQPRRRIRQHHEGPAPAARFRRRPGHRYGELRHGARRHPGVEFADLPQRAGQQAGSPPRRVLDQLDRRRRHLQRHAPDLGPPPSAARTWSTAGRSPARASPW